LRQITRHKQLIAALVAIAVVVASVIALNSWQRPGGGGGNIITSLTVQCRLDPARVPSPPPGAANYLHTCGSEIYDAHGRPVRITGVSWFGFETANKAPDGLWARNWQTILDQLAALGYNTIRL